MSLLYDFSTLRTASLLSLGQIVLRFFDWDEMNISEQTDRDKPKGFIHASFLLLQYPASSSQLRIEARILNSLKS